jgi:hypothetical protein
MTLSRLLAIAAVVSLLYGVGFLLIPEPLSSLYGMKASPSSVLGFRYFGVTLVGLGFAAWFIKDSTDWSATRGFLIAVSISSVAGLLVSIWGTLTGIMSGMGWSAVLIYSLLLIGYLYFLYLGPVSTRRRW